MAGPAFTTPFIKGPEDRLDPTDAQFVQCLHTSNILGTIINCGHADYRANGGDVQPGCGLDLVLCSHSRAAILFRNAVNPLFNYVGSVCAKQNNGLIGNLMNTLTSIVLPPKCTPVLQDLFGIHTNRLPGEFNFKTYDKAPYLAI